MNHHKSQSHAKATEILARKNEKKIQSAVLAAKSRSRQTTERCLRTAYFVAAQNRPYTDYEELIQLQEVNGLDLGYILHGRTTCRDMVHLIGHEMRRGICELRIEKEKRYPSL